MNQEPTASPETARSRPGVSIETATIDQLREYILDALGNADVFDSLASEEEKREFIADYIEECDRVTAAADEEAAGAASMCVTQTPMPILVISSKEDRNTILAALRLYQEQGMGEPSNRSDAIHDIATNDGADISYDADAIDDLCQRVNCAQVTAI